MGNTVLKFRIHLAGHVLFGKRLSLFWTAEWKNICVFWSLNSLKCSAINHEYQDVDTDFARSTLTRSIVVNLLLGCSYKEVILGDVVIWKYNSLRTLRLRYFHLFSAVNVFDAVSIGQRKRVLPAERNLPSLCWWACVGRLTKVARFQW